MIESLKKLRADALSELSTVSTIEEVQPQYVHFLRHIFALYSHVEQTLVSNLGKLCHYSSRQVPT